MTTETRPTQEDLRKLATREVYYCVSSLVATLAGGYGIDVSVTSQQVGAFKALSDLAEQAAELCNPIADYEEAAIQAGYVQVPYVGDLVWVGAEDAEAFKAGDHSLPYWTESAEVCDAEGLDPYEREIFEHWIVSNWLADKLEAKGERIDKDFAGLTVWGRTTTGQAIYMDSVIEDIWRDLHAKAEG